MTSSEPTDEPVFATVHKLRETREGIQYLTQTNRFRDYMQRRIDYRNSTARTHDRMMSRDFVAWDGEGWTDRDLEHRYMYLACSEGYHIEYPQLTTVNCLDVMLTVGAMFPKQIHIVFGGGYDVTHILRDMPFDYRHELSETNYTTWNGYSLHYVPHKWFVVQRGDRRLKLFDVMTFFQCSFINALESRDIEVPEIVRKGKAARADFTFADLDEIKQYTRLELELLVELQDVLREEFRSAGLFLSQWHGPGAVAAKTLHQYRIRSHKMVRPEPETERAVAAAYFGGRFEAFKVGHHPGKVFQYDINSAYPDKIRNLPSLRGARWVRGMGDRDLRYPFRIGFVGYDGSHRAFTDPHPTPWRSKDGAVGFPRYNHGVWLWSYEWPMGTCPDEVFTLATTNDERPFAFVEGLYIKRQEWKQLSLGGERALKLMMNSLYGKMVQQVGYRFDENGWKLPSWHQLEWGGLITSPTRAQLWRAIEQNPAAIIAVETDSITSTEPLRLDIGTALGQWTLTEFDWITYLQSGVYFVPGEGLRIKMKSRGFDADSISHDQVLDYLAGPMDEPLLARARRFIALGNPRDHLYGQWLDEVRELSLNGGKRLHLASECVACRMGLSAAESLHTLSVNPLMGVGESKAYPLPWCVGVVPNDPNYKADTAEYDGTWAADWTA